MVCATNMAAIVLFFFLIFLDSRNFFSPLFAFKIKKRSHLTCVLIYALSYKVFNAVFFFLKQVKTATSRIANYVLFVFKSDPGTQESDITICWL